MWKTALLGAEDIRVEEDDLVGDAARWGTAGTVLGAAAAPVGVSGALAYAAGLSDGLSKREAAALAVRRAVPNLVIGLRHPDKVMRMTSRYGAAAAAILGGIAGGAVGTLSGGIWGAINGR